MSHTLAKLGQPAQPPYRVESCQVGHCIVDSTGYNVLGFPDKPGAKFTDKATCERIIDELRDMGH